MESCYKNYRKTEIFLQLFLYSCIGDECFQAAVSYLLLGIVYKKAAQFCLFVVVIVPLNKTFIQLTAFTLSFLWCQVIIAERIHFKCRCSQLFFNFKIFVLVCKFVFTNKVDQHCQRLMNVPQFLSYHVLISVIAGLFIYKKKGYVLLPFNRVQEPLPVLRTSTRNISSDSIWRWFYNIS